MKPITQVENELMRLSGLLLKTFRVEVLPVYDAGPCDFDDVLHIGNHLWITEGYNPCGDFYSRLAHEIAHCLIASDAERTGVNWRQVSRNGEPIQEHTRHTFQWTQDQIEDLTCRVQYRLLVEVSIKLGLDENDWSPLVKQSMKDVAYERYTWDYPIFEVCEMVKSFVHEGVIPYNFRRLISRDLIGD